MLHQNSSNTNRRCFSSKKRSGWCLGDKVHGCCIKQQPLFFGLIQAQFFFQQSNAFGYSIHALRSHSSRALSDIFDLLPLTVESRFSRCAGLLWAFPRVRNLLNPQSCFKTQIYLIKYIKLKIKNASANCNALQFADAV